jgi:hypothetical protein
MLFFFIITMLFFTVSVVSGQVSCCCCSAVFERCYDSAKICLGIRLVLDALVCTFVFCLLQLVEY